MRKPRKTNLQKSNNQNEMTNVRREVTLEDLNNLDVHLDFLNKNQELLYKSIKKNELTICIGFPGTAKTFISCGTALELLLNSDSLYKKIYLIKSVTTLEGEEIGFLKGTMEEKMDPYLMSFKMNMEKIIEKKYIDFLFKSKKIEVLPLAYLRGVNLDDAIILADETQNLSKFNFKTLLTRLGRNSKMVILGDVKQIDLKDKTKSVLKDVYDMFDNIEKVGRIQFTLDDIIRNPLVSLIETKFEEKWKI